MAKKDAEKKKWEFIETAACRFCDGDIKIKQCHRADGSPRSDYYFRCFGNPEKKIYVCNFRGQYEQSHMNALLRWKKIVPC